MKLICFLLLLLPLSTIAQKNDRPTFDSYMISQEKFKDFSGTVLVAKNGKILYEKGFGLADREWQIPNTVQTKFQIGSITKQFTAAAILQLAEAGRLNVQDKLSKYFPSFPKADSVTIHMLLTHTSGIRNYTDVPEFWKLATINLEKDSMLSLFEKQRYDFLPGTKWNYSNTGYFLLGMIIEKVSGKSYSDYLMENVLNKAGLTNTFLNRWDTIVPQRAHGYMKNNKQWLNAMYISMDAPFSAGALLSTVSDLYKWNNALFSGKIISPASFSSMIRPYMEHYGYGIGIDSMTNHLRIGHSGGIPGFVSYMARFPDDSLVVICLSNNSSNASGVANGLAAIALGMYVTNAYNHVEVYIDSSKLTAYAGNYSLVNGGKLTIIRKGNKLYRARANNDIELKPEAINKFFYGDDSDRQIEFILDKSGMPKQAWFISGGIKEEMTIVSNK
ncbi:MAG: beta-lactamase [Ferruginibacter sp.]|nr:beta-lactamase [Ferruginibacter sp.]